MSKQPDTAALERKTVSVSPDMAIKVKVGALWAAGVTIVGCAITCTAFVVRMEGKVDKGLETSQAIDAKLEKIAPEHAILWDWYTRTASRAMAPRQQP